MLQVLGRGGFGIVLRAFDDVLHRVVAIKVLAPAMAVTSPARKRFLREARSSAQVRHENVVQVHAVEEQPLPYLVMEFIPGETLQQRLDRTGPLDVADVLRIGQQIAEGLAAAHEHGLIHRDIKPGNILLEAGRQRVKITDFGLARAADDASLSVSGVIAGTPMYMAPEQARGEKLDQRADLFSLGSVLYQMAAGRPPFRATGALAVLKRVAEDTPRDIREIIPETPQWLCDIIARLLAKKPDERFQSAREVADLLADCEAKLKAHAQLKDYSRVPRGKARPAGRRKWVTAAALLLLPVLALAVTESTGVTHLFHAKQVTTEPIKPAPIEPGVDPTPVVKQETPPPTYKNSIGMEFVLVPKGKSWLGGSNSRPGDREVEIAADFYLGKYEVTQEEWEKVMGENPSHFSRTGKGMDVVKDIPDAELKRFPVESVSWEDCQRFVSRLNERQKEPGWVYRLPKATEWEYACRGGPMADRPESAFEFYLAEPAKTLLPKQANFMHGGRPIRTCKVGSYPPNRLGLCDMHGNVWEWCDETEKAADGAVHQFIRGGAWNGAFWFCRAADRHPIRPSVNRSDNKGLRLARVPSPEAKTPPTDPDRKAAAYVLSVGGKVKVNDEPKAIKAAADLPRKPFRLTEIRLAGNQQGADAGLAVLRDCKNLTLLELTSAPVTDAGVTHIPNCRELWLQHTPLVTDAALAHLKECKGLWQLHLAGLPKVTDAGLAHLRHCRTLTYLNLDSTPVTDAGLVHLKECKNLTRLELHNNKRITDAGLLQLKGLDKLTWLNLSNTQVTAKGVEGLAKTLPKCKITWNGGVIGPR